jgi:hypothetical protein
VGKWANRARFKYGYTDAMCILATLDEDGGRRNEGKALGAI